MYTTRSFSSIYTRILTHVQPRTRIYGRANKLQRTRGTFGLDRDFRMRLSVQTNRPTTLLRYKHHRQIQNGETKRRAPAKTPTKTTTNNNKGRGKRRERWPEFCRRKSTGKIHGSLCRAAVWQIVYVYKTYFYPLLPLWLFFHESLIRETDSRARVYKHCHRIKNGKCIDSSCRPTDKGKDRRRPHLLLRNKEFWREWPK